MSDKAEVKARLISDLPRLIQEKLPKARKSGTEYRVGDLSGAKGSSTSIETAGDDAGVWHDFNTETKGDVLDLFARLEGLPTGAPFPEVLKAARQYLGMPEPEAGPQVTINGTTHKATNAKSTSVDAPDQATTREKQSQDKPDWLPAFIQQAQAALETGDSAAAARAREYIASRGLTTRLQAFGVIDDTVTMPPHWDADYSRGVRGRLLIVYQDERNQPCYFIARDLTGQADDKYKYLKPKGLSMPAPFNAPALAEAEKRGTLILTEGELDALSLTIAYGKRHPVIGCSGGTLPKGWHERIAAAGCEVLILFDTDKPGIDKAEAMRAKLSGLEGAGPVRILRLQGPHKDANDILRADGPAGLVQAVEDAAEAARHAGISDYLYVTETWLSEINTRADRKHSYYTTGLPALDKLLGGGYLEGLHLLGGITGGGKTSLALSIAMHNALEGRTVIYGSYEQSRLELWARIASRVTGIPQRAIKAGKYDDRGREYRTVDMLKDSEHWPKLQQLSKHLKVVEGGDAFSRQAGEWTVNTLASTAQEIQEAQGSPPLIIIDYLQRMPPPPEVNTREVRDRIGAVAGSLQVMLGRGAQAPVLALSSVGRASYNAENFAKLPVDERLTAFKEAGELEYTSYTALTLYALPESKRGQEMNPPRNLDGSPQFLPRTLDLVKNREGKTGRLAVKWRPWADDWSGAIDYKTDKEAL